jgi:hypothetical protein
MIITCRDITVTKNRRTLIHNLMLIRMLASSSGARTKCENFGQMKDMVGDALRVNLPYKGGGEEEIIRTRKV